MAFEFKIQIEGISKPPVWRQVKMTENHTFERFHVAIQNAFGWGNGHPYMFSPHGYGSAYQIEELNEWSEGNTSDARKTKLKDIFTEEKQTFTYIYDFGDDWTQNHPGKNHAGKSHQAVLYWWQRQMPAGRLWWHLGLP
jgi:hypothetical protein